MIEKIPFHRPYPLDDFEIDIIKENTKYIIKSGKLSKNGIFVQQLERRIKNIYDVKYVLATGNCTSGLQICLSYLNHDSYIQVPAFEWWSILYILKCLNRDILWRDIDIKTWLPMDTKFHQSLYMNTFGNIGRSNNENAIYDSSHCLGAKIRHLGLAHVFSLAPTKLVTSCEGGIIITNNDDFYEFAKERRDKISRMSEVHALIGNVYLDHLNEILEWKKKVYDYYKKHIPGLFQEVQSNSTYNTIGFLNIDNLEIPENIEIRQYYEPIHKNEIKKNTKIVHEKIICLPSYFGCPYQDITQSILDQNHL